MATNREKVMEYVENGKYRHIMTDYSGMGETIEPECNDCMNIYIKVNGREIITDTSFTITEDACAPVVACAEIVCQMIKDKAVLVAYTINKDKIAEKISDDGSLDKEHVHCAIMAELTIKRAVLDYISKKPV